MNIFEKLVDIQRRIDGLTKDGTNTSDKYDFVSDEGVLNTFRPLMNEHALLLIPKVTGYNVREGATRSGTTRYFTEMAFEMVWHDAESGEELVCPWYAQGVDLAGEKGTGKAATYAEKYFLLKFFHVPTSKADPDEDGRTKTGEKRQKGTQAAKENADYYRAAIGQMLDAFCEGDEAKKAVAIKTWTQNTERGIEGLEKLADVSDAALPVIYAKAQKQYKKRLGKDFVFEGAE